MGGFDIDAAEDVLDLAHWNAWTLDVLQGLIDQSLLRRQESKPGQVRFVMFESIREYARGRLKEDDDEGTDEGFAFLGPAAFERCRRAHVDYFAGLGRAYRLLEEGGRAAVVAVDGLEAEVENVVAALLSAIEFDDVDSAANCALAASRVYQRKGPILSALGMLHRLQEVFQLDGDLLFEVLHEQGVHQGDAGRRDASAETFEAAIGLETELRIRRIP